jgi:formate C-acetyltransferase
MVDHSLEAYDYKFDKNVEKNFNEFRKTHNQGVFDVYTSNIRSMRSSGILTGLPDAYGRGRIIGDFRRLALYGAEKLILQKQKDLKSLQDGEMLDDLIRLREEISEQIRALNKIKSMASKYGFDVSKPATNAKQAVQFLYFAYLATVKESNGAAMSFGRNAAFLDIYIENDIKKGVLTEQKAQEIIDHLIIKLRLVRHLRTPDYDELFAGDPTWVTESLGGMGEDGRSLVTKTTFRFLHSLTNLDSAPEPNMTVLWSQGLPVNFKKFCSKLSIQTDSIQYENDDIMRPIYGDDYGVACCVSAMTLGKQMQFFGARCNLGKALLYAINQGKDEISEKTVINGIPALKNNDVLDYEDVMQNYKTVVKILAKEYVSAMNIIHYMHDKYAYESSEFAFIDSNVNHIMAFGIAGLSVVADSLSAIKHAKVKPIRNENGIAVDFETQGEYPCYGNDDDKVDDIAKEITEMFFEQLNMHKTYKDAKHTLSVLTITSNVVYGKKTGSTPDGRKKGEPFAPGANPMHGRDKSGVLASLNSVAKIKYACNCEDGVSNTVTIVPQTLGKTLMERIDNLTNILDGYFVQGAHHLNVNVLDKETLEDAMENPEKYPLLTIRVSGYAVRFNRLNKTQQEEVIARTFHEKI